MGSLPSRPDPPEHPVATLSQALMGPILQRLHEWQCRRDSFLQVSRYRVALRSWRPGTMVRAVFLTDFHFGDSTPTWFLRQAVDRAMAERPDLVLLGGDLWTYSRDPQEDAQHILAALHAPLGVYAVLGNHDLYVGREHAERLVTSIGGTLLTNAGVVLGTHGGQLYLCGVDDAWRGDPDLAAAMAGCPRGTASLLLAHQARSLLLPSPHRPDLCLAGHTHGGQVCWPWGRPLWFYDRHLLDHGRGWCRVGHTWLFVSRGLGSAPMPLRVNCPPEVLVLSLCGPSARGR